MLFYLHKEGKIGYKELSSADLGLGTSHQTHIGLFDDVLTFLPDKIEIPDAMLIYDNHVYDNLPVYFDRIQNPNGTYRSPKIRTGGNGDGITKSIRKIAKDNGGLLKKWFLIWFALEDEKPIFYLINSESEEIEKLKSLGLDLVSKNDIKGRISITDGAYINLVNFLEELVNKTNSALLKELEICAQTNDIPKGKFRALDLENARKKALATGLKGEIAVKIYFENLVKEGKILSFVWYNDANESFLPYDYHIETLDHKIIYLDVKTTAYEFDQKVIFSSQEIRFADSHKDAYNIYRVYMRNNKYCLRICHDTSNLFSEIEKAIVNFIDALSESVDIETMKLSILPKTKELLFSEEINI